MPKRTDIKKILIIGSGPIVIGQACEFDYSGTQACKALRDEGYEVVLINSNPATIMTDPETAERTYIEPITPEIVERIIEKERPDALLPTMGGQTALNIAVELSENGALDKYGVELIGAKLKAIKMAEDRNEFKIAIRRIGLSLPESEYVRSLEDAKKAINKIGFPAIIRPSFTLGGTGGNVAYNIEELEEYVEWGLSLSPRHEILIEQSVLGWKEFELEVMRDLKDNVVITSKDRGSQMTTDTLDWNRNKDLISTKDPVKIVDEQGVVTGVGMSAHPNLKKTQINKNVKAVVHTQPEGEPVDQIVTITSDGPMQMNQVTMYAVFTIHVIAVDASTGRELHCDKMEVWFDQATKKIKKVICTGHVKVIQGPDVSYADRMVYDGVTQLLTMTGRPKIIFVTGGAKGGGLSQSLGSEAKSKKTPTEHGKVPVEQEKVPLESGKTP